MSKTNKYNLVDLRTIGEAKTSFEQSEKLLLGSIAKSSTFFGIPDSSLDPIKATRAKRYNLARSIRNIFIKEGIAKGLDIPTKYHRQSLCKWSMTGTEVHLMKDDATSKAFFSGVQTCGSVWCCPVCANRIQEVRRQEIAKAMKYFYSKGKQAAMVTLTFPHSYDMPLIDLLTKQSKALALLREGENWTKFKNKIGFQGLIRALEIMRGLNGWHPHTHELWFINAEQDEDEFKEYVLKKWLSSCIKAGLVNADDLKQVRAFKKHSLDIRFNCDSSDYLAKCDDKANWGIDREMAKASTKMGKSKGMHPFEMAYQGYSKLWLEFANAIKVKRSRQIYWSQDLKDLVGINEKKDEDIAKEEEEIEAVLVGVLDGFTWGKILYRDLRSRVLDWAEEGYNIEVIKSFILRIVQDNLKNE